MNPEEIRALLEGVMRARRDGRSDAEIDAFFSQSRDIPFDNVASLAEFAHSQGVLPDEFVRTAPPQEGTTVRQRLSPILQGLTGSFASDIFAGLERLGVAEEGTAERYREGLAHMREEDPVGAFMGQAFGSVVGAPGRVAKASMPVIRGGERLGRAAAARVGGRGITNAPSLLGTAGGVGGGAVAGAAVAGAEGAVMGFGEGAGQDMEGRLDTAAGWGAFSAATGGLLGTLGPAFRDTRNLMRAGRERGVRLEQALMEGADIPTPRSTRGGIRAAKSEADVGFDLARQQTQIPAEVTDAVVSHPSSMRALRAAGSQESQEFLEQLARHRAGEGPMPSLTFRLADEIRQDVKGLADLQAKRALTPDGRPVPQTRIREAKEALAALDEAMKGVPGYQIGVDASALQHGQRRSMIAGRKSMNHTADVMEDILNGLDIPDLPDLRIEPGPEAREAFRAGAMDQLLENLAGDPERLRSFVQGLPNNREMQRKLRLIFDNDAAYQGFMDAVRREGHLIGASGIATNAIRYLGFLYLGSSLGGRIIEGLL